MKKAKKALSLVLALVMVLSLFPVFSASAIKPDTPVDELYYDEGWYINTTEILKGKELLRGTKL